MTNRDSIWQGERDQVQAELEARRAAFAERKRWCSCAKPRAGRTYSGHRQCIGCGRLIHGRRLPWSKR